MTSLSGWLIITKQDKLKFLTPDTDSYRYRYRDNKIYRISRGKIL